MFLEDIGGSPSFEIINLVLKKIENGEKVLSLAIGEPSFDTPTEIIEAGSRSMQAGDVHYVSSYGIPEVREAIRSKVNRRNGIRAQIANTIFATTKFSVYASLVAVSNKAFDVLIPDPGYFYAGPAVLAGGRPIFYELNKDFSLNIDEIRREITRRTKAILVNTPGNPTGQVLTKSELAELYNFCREREIYVISDEAYEDLVYEREHFSVGSLERKPEFVISIFSLSKSYAMTGWRAGYVIASERIIQLVNRFLENTVSCFPPFIQKASAFALNNCDKRILEFRRELERRKNLLEEEIKKIELLDGNRIEGAFYAFPRYRLRVPSTDLSRRILEKSNVAVLPGAGFGPAGEGHLRISFSASPETINAGMSGLRRFFEGLNRE